MEYVNTSDSGHKCLSYYSKLDNNDGPRVQSSSSQIVWTSEPQTMPLYLPPRPSWVVLCVQGGHIEGVVSETKEREAFIK